VLGHLSSHPHRLHPQYVDQYNRLQSRIIAVLDIMQTLKPQIEARFDAYQQELSEREARRISSEDSSETSPDLPFSPSSQRPQNITLDHTLAMEIAIEEYSKLEHEKRKSRQPTALDSRGREIRRVSAPSSGSYAHDLRQLSHSPPLPSDYISEFRKDAEEEAMRNLSWVHEDGEPLDDQARYEYVTPSDDRARYEYVAPSDDRARYEYAVLPRKQRRNHNDGFDMSQFRNLPDFAREPEKQAREDVVGRWKGTYPTVPKSQYPSVPPLKVFYPDPTIRESPAPPPKIPEYLRPPTPPRAALPAIPPKEKEPILKDFSTPAQLEDGTPLRTMFLPGALRQNFLQIARSNTRNNLETCGILCGTLIRNALFVTRLVIPEQESTSDTCQTKDEEGLFEYCSTEDLMVLGWIHTHPTQTCFMSSVDLHTHAGYQLMLPESIAIVCAPSQTPA
jgi:STAM-binding protein